MQFTAKEGWLETHTKLVGYDPKSGGGVDRESSSDALGSRFEPRSLYKYGFFSPKPKGSTLHRAGRMDFLIEWRAQFQTMPESLNGF